MRYTAFLSYSHSVDGELAPRVQSVIHRLAKPWYRIRQLHVFRDKTNLAASPGLWSSIEAALQNSEWLLVMASPQAAASPWVQKEILWWVEHRPLEKLLLLLTGGDLVWDAGRNDFDWEKTTALPPLLRERFAEEPLHVDLRWASRRDDLSIRHLRFRSAILDIAAPLSGRAKEDLDGEDVRQNRLARRLAWSAAIGLLVLTGISIGAAVVANVQRREAITLSKRALSRQLAAQSATDLPERFDRALLLAALATRFEPTLEARRSLLRALLWPSGHPRLLWGHGGAVTSAAFSPDGKGLASASSDGAVILWDASAMTPRGPLPKRHTEGVNGLAWSPDGVFLATAGDDKSVLLWNAHARTPVGEPLHGHDAGVFSVAFSPDGKTLASAGQDGGVVLWDVAGRKPVGARLAGNRWEEYELRFSPDGRTLVSAPRSGGLMFWNLAKRGPVGALMREGTAPVAFHPSGKLFAAQSVDNTVALWDSARHLPVGRPLRGHSAFVSSLAFSPDLRTLASASGDGTIILWNIETGQPSGGPLRANAGAVLTLAFSPDGRRLVSGGAGGSLAVWDLLDASPVGTRLPRSEGYRPMRVAFSRGGDRLTSVLAGSRGGFLEWWGVAGRRPVARGRLEDSALRTPTVLAVDIAADTLVRATDDGGVSLWDTRAGSVARGLVAEADRPVTSLSLSRDARSVACGTSDGTLLLFDVKGHGLVGRSLEGHRERVDSVAVSSDGRRLASGDTDGWIMLWDAVSPQPPERLSADSRTSVFSLAFSPDDRTLASGGLDGVVLWDVATGRARRELNTGGRPVYSLAFARDGGLLAVGTSDGKLLLWDVSTANLLETFSGHTGEVEQLSFAEDGRRLASMGRDGDVFVWDMDVARWREEACEIANRDFTPQEWATYVGDTPADEQRACGSR